MPAGATYDPIATTTLTSSVATIDFTSISGSYTDLVLVATVKATAGADVWIRCNDDAGANQYVYQVLYAHQPGAGYARGSTAQGLLTDWYGTPSTDNNHALICDFLDYSNTTKFKTMVARSNRAASGVDCVTNVWRGTSAITKLTMRFSNATNFDAGTIVSLYGITKA